MDGTLAMFWTWAELVSRGERGDVSATVEITRVESMTRSSLSIGDGKPALIFSRLLRPHSNRPKSGAFQEKEASCERACLPHHRNSCHCNVAYQWRRQRVLQRKRKRGNWKQRLQPYMQRSYLPDAGTATMYLTRHNCFLGC